MKGIILAGGEGTRLYPMTKSVSKQLLPIYDKPMIYYPLSVLMLAGITEILLISTPYDINDYKKLLGDGLKIGIKLEYIVQENPNGLAQAFILGEEFIGDDNVCLVLGDNVFYGQFFSNLLLKACNETEKGISTIFGYPVSQPKEIGVVEFDDNGKVVSIEEKPINPKSNYAVPGLYFYTNDVVEIAKKVKPSPRGELEITSINNEFLAHEKLNVILMGRGMAWLDTGSPKGIHKASSFVRTVQDMQGLYIACIEEIAYRKGYISQERLRELGEEIKQTEYGEYLIKISKESL